MSEYAHDHRFTTTRWSVVVRAGSPGEEARAALATLCELYWQPLYFFLRRKGHAPEQAMDLVQGFLASLLERGQLATLDPARGRFRSYLMAGLSHFLSNERAREHALKRGGGAAHLSLDAEEAEHAYQVADAGSRTPERLYERRWALNLLERVMAGLRADYIARGQQDVFDALKGSITGEMTETYADAGRRLDLSETAVKVAAHRMRARYRALFRETVLATVEDEAAFEDEVRFLLDAVRG